MTLRMYEVSITRKDTGQVIHTEQTEASSPAEAIDNVGFRPASDPNLKAEAKELPDAGTEEAEIPWEIRASQEATAQQ